MASPRASRTQSRSAQRIEKLEAIEKDIAKLMSLAGKAVNELCESNPSRETVEYTTKDFLKTLDGIDKCLSEQIQYLMQVSTMQAHEGSVYAAEKDYELSCLQAVLAKERLQRLQVGGGGGGGSQGSLRSREPFWTNGHSETAAVASSLPSTHSHPP